MTVQDLHQVGLRRSFELRATKTPEIFKSTKARWLSSVKYYEYRLKQLALTGHELIIRRLFFFGGGGELIIGILRYVTKATSTCIQEIQSNLSLRTPLKYGHLSITDSPHGPKETKFHTNSTSIIRTPLYYGQSTWSKRDQIPYKLYLYNTDTSLLRTVHMVQKRPNSIQTLPL